MLLNRLALLRNLVARRLLNLRLHQRDCLAHYGQRSGLASHSHSGRWSSFGLASSLGGSLRTLDRSN
jgi:hypothetical protein